MDYRREIDGLRALAVLPVIFFHAGFQTFSGGFVGVDIFFVISGYLITSIILAEMEAGTFTLANFYERRARRILPALFVVMALCLPFAWLWLLPQDMKSFSQSLVAVSAFASNVLFWRTSGYFDTAAELKPLLHTWSLAVEEQYYLLFPLFVLLTWRFGKTWILKSLFAVFIISLAAAHWGSTNKPVFTFFLLPTRGWELLIGGFIAFYFSLGHKQLSHKWLNELGSLIGVSLIAYSIFSFDSKTPFPSLYTLVPTVGTALIIFFTTPQTSTGKLLGSKIFVGVGLISYSAYLYHQPLLAFAKHRSIDEPSSLLIGLLIAATFCLAYFSWRFVEAPIRNKQRINRKQLFTFCVLASFAFALFGLIGHFNKGHTGRMPIQILTLSAPKSGSSTSCDEELYNTKQGCLIGSTIVKPTVALVGDSHSDVLRLALSEQLSSKKLSAISYYGSWCAPLIDIGTDDAQKNPKCRKFINEAYESILEDSEISTVILVAEWGNYTQGFRWADSGVAYYYDSSSFTRTVSENSNAVARGVERTLSKLLAAKKKVIFVKSVPEYSTNIPSKLSKSFLFSDKLYLPENLVVSQSDYFQRNKEIESLILKSTVIRQVSVVETMKIFCPLFQCEYAKDNEPYYIDGNHLSYRGATLLTDEILKHIN